MPSKTMRAIGRSDLAASGRRILDFATSLRKGDADAKQAERDQMVEDLKLQMDVARTGSFLETQQLTQDELRFKLQERVEKSNEANQPYYLKDIFAKYPNKIIAEKHRQQMIGLGMVKTDERGVDFIMGDDRKKFGEEVASTPMGMNEWAQAEKADSALKIQNIQTRMAQIIDKSKNKDYTQDKEYQELLQAAHVESKRHARAFKATTGFNTLNASLNKNFTGDSVKSFIAGTGELMPKPEKAAKVVGELTEDQVQIMFENAAVEGELQKVEMSQAYVSIRDHLISQNPSVPIERLRLEAANKAIEKVIRGDDGGELFPSHEIDSDDAELRDKLGF